MKNSDGTAIACGVMARVPRPVDPGDAKQVQCYREAVVKRHLRSMLVRYRAGTYSHLWMNNIWETLTSILVHASVMKGDEHSRWDELRKNIVEAANRRLTASRNKPFSQRQRSECMSGVTQAQLDALCSSIAASTCEIEECVRSERWRQVCNEGADDFLARDATIEQLRYEHASGQHGEPITKVRIFGVGDVAALDEQLCTAKWPAAIEQELESEDTGRYAYQKGADGCYVVCIYHPDDLDSVLNQILSSGSVTVREVTQHWSKVQQERAAALKPAKDKSALLQVFEQALQGGFQDLGAWMQIKIEGGGDIAALDAGLNADFAAAVEQAFEGGKYFYRKAADQTFTVRVHAVEFAARIKERIASCGFAVVSEETHEK